MPKINVEKIQSLTGHKDCLYTLTGKRQDKIFTSGGDGLIVEWDINNPEVGKMIAKSSNSVYSLILSNDQNKIYFGQNFEGIHSINLTTKEEKKSKKITESYIFDIAEVADKLFCACGDGTLIILNSEDLSLLNKISISQKSLRSIAYNFELNQLAIGASDNLIYILNSENYQTAHVLKSHTNSVFSVAYHPNLPLLLSTGRDAHIKIWDTSTFKLIDEIVAHMYAINHISFSKDGNYFASCSMDKSIKLWDAHSFKLLKVIDKARHAGHGTSVNKLWWTGNELQLVSVSDDRTGALWQIEIDN